MSLDRFPHLAQHLFNTPLALAPHKAEMVVAALADRLGIARLFRGDGSILGLADGGAQAYLDAEDPQPGRDIGYDVVQGVAVIPICGTLVNKLGTIRPYSGMTGYDGIRIRVLRAAADPGVRAIMLDIDSPGGAVAGNFDLVDTIYSLRGVKPIWAVLTEQAYSAAYSIASAASRIVVPRTGGVGSIGTILLHTDMSRALDQDGISVTLIRFGARKAEANEVEPLSQSARAALQAEVDAAGELFVETVARNRGLSAATVRGTEAACLRADEGVALGLADAVMAPDAAFRALVASI